MNSGSTRKPKSRQSGRLAIAVGGGLVVLVLAAALLKPWSFFDTRSARGGHSSDGFDQPTPPPAIDPSSSPKDQFQRLSEYYVAPREAYLTNPDRARKTADAFLGLARAHPTDPVAIDSIRWVVEKHHFKPTFVEAMDLLRKEHVANEKLPWIFEPVLGNLGLLGGEPCDSLENLLRATIEKSPHRDVRRRATLGLARYLAHRKEDSELRAVIYQAAQTSPPRYWTNESLKSWGDEAIQRYESAIRDFADAPDAAAQIERELYIFKNLAVGARAPEIMGVDLDGERLKLSDYRGKVVLLEFWSHKFCAPCRAIYPELRALAERRQDQPFAMLGVNYGDSAAELRQLRADCAVTWRFWCDGVEGEGEGGELGPIHTAWDVHGWPTSYIIDADGIIRYKGPTVLDTINTVISVLLRQQQYGL